MDLLENIVLEIGIFIFFGVLYYYYQKRKIVQFEANKFPIVMGMILQSCLTDKSEERNQPELDAVIEALDDYLQNKTPTPPISLLKHFSQSEACSAELREVISAGLKELGNDDGQE